MAVPSAESKRYALGKLPKISPLIRVCHLLDEATETLDSDPKCKLTHREKLILDAMSKLTRAMLGSSLTDGDKAATSATLDVMAYMNDGFFETQVKPTLVQGEVRRASIILQEEEANKAVENLAIAKRRTSDIMVDAEMLAAMYAPEVKSVRCFINPTSPKRILWDVSVLFLVLVDSITVPYSIAYHFDGMEEDAWYWFGTLFFAIDIVFNFFTGYIAGPLEKDHGRLVVAQSRIIKNYLRTWFIIDFCSTVPFAWLMEQSVGGTDGASSTRVAKVTKVVKLARFLRLARMLKLLKLQALWELVESSLGSLSSLYVIHLMKVLLAVLYLCHWNACIWWAVGSEGSLFSMEKDVGRVARWTNNQITKVFANSHGEEWTVNYSWADKSVDVTDRYIFSFYWTLGVMRTMPAEVYPVNRAERVYALIFLFIAFISFAICISRVTQIYNKIGSRRTEFDEQFAHVKNFLHINDIQPDLCLRIRRFLEYQFTQRRIFAKESNMLRELSETLSTELKCGLYMRSVQSLTYFRGVHNDVLHPLILSCNLCDVGPNEMLSSMNKVASRVSILQSGMAARYDTSVGISLNDEDDEILYSGSCIDEYCLIIRQETLSEMNIWAVNFCDFIVIEKVDFNELRMANPQLNAIMDAFARSNTGAAVIRRLRARGRTSSML